MFGLFLVPFCRRTICNWLASVREYLGLLASNQASPAPLITSFPTGNRLGPAASPAGARRVTAAPAACAPSGPPRMRSGRGDPQFTRQSRTAPYGPPCPPGRAFPDYVHDPPGTLPVTRAVRAKRALRPAPVVLMRSVRMPAHAQPGGPILR